MMMLSKVLTCLLVLAGINFFTAFGIYISTPCLLKICTSDTRQCASNLPSSNLTVSNQDAHAVNDLLWLTPQTESGFYCTSYDVSKYSRLIGCSCVPPVTDNGTCRVTYIDFSNMDLRGSLNRHIGDLTYLKFLDLSGNKLSGLIPTSLANLTQLRFLDLCDNNLEGPVPPFNGGNKELRNLYLCNNQLNGSIPKELGELPSLQYLFLRSNTLGGAIPNEIWNIKTLVQLEVQDNQLGGPLPEQLGNLKNLEELVLMNNNFSGDFPKRIGEMTNLRSLQIQGSNFVGTIPDAINQLQNLEILWLLGNNFEGPLPKSFALKSLRDLAITDVADEKGLPFPDVRSLTNLAGLTLRNCSLTGQIPNEVWQLPNLTHLDLTFNKLTGEVPLTLKHNFTTIYLGRNNLNGSLPRWDNFTTYIDVSENLFTNATFLNGTISNNTNLFACCSSTNDMNKKWLDVSYHCANEKLLTDHLYINCGGNATFINGSYYEADLDPDGRSTFFLSNNSTWAYSSIGAFVYAPNSPYILNQTCNISMADAPLYTGARVAPISLKYYGFCLRNDNYTVRLHFAEIGWDPTKDNDIGARRVFNVEIQSKKELHDFNIKEEAAGSMYKDVTREFTALVTDNRLEIHLYWSGKGSMFVPKQYGPLISAISVSAVPKKHHKLSSVSIGAIAGSSVIFVALIFALCWMLGWLGGKKPNKDGVELYPGGIYNFQEIKVATNNFDINRKIGETGSVYQGVLVDGTEVAVKQLSVKSKQEAHEIIKEIGIIYALQHPNVAKPMGCCIKERQVLLVYKFMENISLQNALFGSTEVRSMLNWQTRFKICLGMAKGLAFLHEESKLDIIHSNIKPTNILLDKDFNVKISDFRYSELHVGQLNKEESTFHNMPRAKDTGHMAPEYMQGLPLTPKADVYSFGLVTLEVISGQPHIIVKPKEDIQLLNTAYKYYEEGNLEGLIDGSLNHHKDYKHNEVVTILHLAMRCVSPSFDLRPSMSEVVQILEGKMKIKCKRINPSPMVETKGSPSHYTGSGSTSQVGVSNSNVSDS